MAPPAANLSRDMSDLLKEHEIAKMCYQDIQEHLRPMSFSAQPSGLSTVRFQSVSYLIFFCSVRSPSLTNMADSRRRVEFADLDWLFFIPNNQRTSNLMACTCEHKKDRKHGSLQLKNSVPIPRTSILLIVESHKWQTAQVRVVNTTVAFPSYFSQDFR